MEESPALPADHMRVWYCRRLPEIAKGTQDGLTLEPLCQRRLAGSAQFLVSPPRGSGRAQDTCIGMPFFRNGRPEPGPDPSEGPQRPSSVSHKTRRTLSLSAGSKQKQTGNPDISANNCDPIQHVRIGPPDRQVISVNVANTFVCFVLLSMAYMISWILRGLRPQANKNFA